MEPDSESQDPANPFAAPEEVSDDWAGGRIWQADPQAIRNQHYWHEQNVRSIGGLLVLAAGTPLLTWLFGLPNLVTVAATILGLIVAWAGRGVWRLDPHYRTTGLFALVLVLLLFPCGTVAALVSLPVFLSPKAQRVMTDEYHEVMKTTHGPPGNWLFDVAIAMLVAGAIVAALLIFM